ncbi:MAG: SPOR domain-containing protein [Bacteroides sp.]|nr:SPOR domain-containing protein [Bacteroides sp.]
MKIFFLLFSLFWVLNGWAQPVVEPEENSQQLQLDIRQDARIDQLLEAYKEVVSRERGFTGYRVQIYADAGNQSKLRTQRRKAEFDTKYPGVESYIIYDAPDFKLRVGNFRTRLDARRFLEKIARDYESAYIVVDRIEYPGFE